MKKLLAIGLAAIMAAGAFALAPSAASAQGIYFNGPGPMNPYRYTYRYPRQRPPGAYFLYRAPGFTFSFRAPIYRQRSMMNPHVAWCLRHYRTYNPATNLFFIKRGVPAVCISPFSY